MAFLSFNERCEHDKSIKRVWISYKNHIKYRSIFLSSIEPQCLLLCTNDFIISLSDNKTHKQISCWINNWKGLQLLFYVFVYSFLLCPTCPPAVSAWGYVYSISQTNSLLFLSQKLLPMCVYSSASQFIGALLLGTANRGLSKEQAPNLFCLPAVAFNIPQFIFVFQPSPSIFLCVHLFLLGNPP